MPKSFFFKAALFGLLAAIALFLAGQYVWLHRAQSVISWAMAGKTVVVDAGHGGIDPGVVGVSGSLEKDVNLAVAKDLAELLRGGGATVIMTREGDAELSVVKQEDLAARIALAAAADFYISLHGNSFPADRSQHGAQVFYYKDNQEGQRLASLVQQKLNQKLDSRDRVALAHADSYLLKNLTLPAVIVELGFLSNAEEEALLLDRQYQWQLAYAVYSGAAAYFADDE